MILWILELVSYLSVLSWGISFQLVEKPAEIKLIIIPDDFRNFIDGMQQKETYMRGNRILLGAVSIILFIAGLTNYCNVVFTGMYARRKEFDVMKSIGMTDKQMKLMLFGEGSYYFMCVVGLLFTVGMAVVFGVKIYMENKLSYFTFYWPIHITVGVILSLLLINVAVTHFICKKR